MPDETDSDITDIEARQLTSDADEVFLAIKDDEEWDKSGTVTARATLRHHIGVRRYSAAFSLLSRMGVV